MSRKHEILIEAVFSAVLLINGYAIVTLSGVRGPYRVLPPSNWGFVFLTAAAMLGLISDSDYPEMIRKSKALRAQLRLLFLWQLVAGILFTSMSGFLVAVPDLVVICVASVFGLISISMVIVHSLNRMNGTYVP